MNVLFVIRGVDTYSSQQAQIELALGLLKKKVNIYILGEASKEVQKEIKKSKIPFINLYPKKKIDRNYIHQLKEIVDTLQIQIVHFTDGKALRSGIIALKNQPVKIIAYFGSVSLHWYDPSSYLTYLHPRVDTIICNSNFVYNHVKKQLQTKYKHKAVRIFKGYNPNWFLNRKPNNLSEFSIPQNAVTVAFIGNHRKVKGTKYFIKSSFYINFDKEIHFLLIGNKTDSNTFKSLAAKSPLVKNIHFLGKRNDAVSILQSCDIYVQTSLSEGFGRAISEAMSLGKPVVMTNAGGCTELIDKNSGIVVPLKNAPAVGSAISKLADDENLRLQMGENAKNRIASVYPISNTIDETLELYQQLIIKGS